MAKAKKQEVKNQNEGDIDPLTEGKTMYGEDVKGSSTEVPNADVSEQDEVAEGRTEDDVVAQKPSKK